MAAIEKHYTVKELVQLLSWSTTRIRKNFKYHPLTVRDGGRFFVPHSVVEAVLAQKQNRASVLKPRRRGRPMKPRMPLF